MRVTEKTYTLKTFSCDKCDFDTQSQELIERHEFLDHNPDVKHFTSILDEDIYCFYLRTDKDAGDAARIAEYDDNLKQDITPGWYYYQHSFEYDSVSCFKPVSELLKEEQEHLDKQIRCVEELKALAS